jgi:hypothetical protein
MIVSTLVCVQLLAKCFTLVQSTSTGAWEMISMAQNSPIIAGTPCTSRTLRQSSLIDDIITLPDSTNDTTGDDWFDGEDELDFSLSSFSPYCPDGYFCDLSGNEDKATVDEMIGLCKPCSGSSDFCASNSVLTERNTGSQSPAYSLEKAVMNECREQCGVQKNKCSSTTDCTQGLFCNFVDAQAGGYCEECPFHLHFCKVGKNLTSEGLNACELSCASHCKPQGTLKLSTQATSKTTEKMTSSLIFIDDVQALHGSPQLTATGPIVDCGLGLDPCEGVEGSICLIERGYSPFVNKTRNCYTGGGIAAVIYNVEKSCENIDGSFFGQETYIPSVSLKNLDAKAILKEMRSLPPEKPLVATVEVGGHDTIPGDCVLGCTEANECEGTDLICNYDNGEFGDCKATESKAFCNDKKSFLTNHLECTVEGEFCDQASGGRGMCRSCPTIEGACFFIGLSQNGTKACNDACFNGGSEQFESAPCKFCPKANFSIGDLGDGFQSTEKENVTIPCEFCASTSESECSSVNRWDMKHPKRT